jgi:hypothetical protein
MNKKADSLLKTTFKQKSQRFFVSSFSSFIHTLTHIQPQTPKALYSLLILNFFMKFAEPLDGSLYVLGAVSMTLYRQKSTHASFLGWYIYVYVWRTLCGRIDAKVVSHKL